MYTTRRNDAVVRPGTNEGSLDLDPRPMDRFVPLYNNNV